MGVDTNAERVKITPLQDGSGDGPILSLLLLDMVLFLLALLTTLSSYQICLTIY